MTPLARSVIAVDDWPWSRLLETAQIIQWFDNVKVLDENGIPPALRAMFRSISDVKLAQLWQGILKRGGVIPDGLILATRDKLLDIGYRSELVGALVVALIAACIKSSMDDDVEFEPPISQLTLHVAKSVLGGLSGDPDIPTVKWLLDHANDCGEQGASELLRSLADAELGDSTARLKVVQLVIPYWHALVDAGLLSRWDEHADALGLPYQYASDIKDLPEVLTLRARLLYVNGHAGDEDEAVRLAIDAALSGSSKAWGLLNDWRLAGDDARVLRCLLSLGSTRLTGINCLTDQG